MKTIRMIIGSTRPERVSPAVARWIGERLRAGAEDAGDIAVEETDLKELALPFFDEPSPPIFGRYIRPHTKAWAETVRSSDGFLFITPEYNHGYSAVLKNALDYLYAEWHHKPVAFVSYGGDGGGTRAVEQLRAVVGELRMYDLGEMVRIPEYWNYLGEDGSLNPPQRYADAAEATVNALVHWTRVMAAGRPGAG
jgi:NAD(P)H-dependent FMN reductase